MSSTTDYKDSSASSTKPIISNDIYDYIANHRSNFRLEEFFKHFMYTDKRLAHRDYATVIKCNLFSKSQQQKLAMGFERWKINKADIFWSEVMKSRTTTLSLTSTETSLIRNAAPLANSSIEHEAKIKIGADNIGSTSAGKKHPRDDNSTLQPNSHNTKQSRRVSFGRDLTLEDLKTPDDNICNRSIPGSLKSSVNSSTNTDDGSYRTDQSLDESTSKIFTWNYLVGDGRVDSRVDNEWIVGELRVGHQLMDFRNRVVLENGGLTGPYEKLAINFKFLIEADYQTGGLQGQLDDDVWESLCNTVKDNVPQLPGEIVIEAHQWAHRLAQNNPENFLQLLEDDPPHNYTLKTILTKMTDTTQLWNTNFRNEDTYLKTQLGPFLETYFGKVKYTKSSWTPVHDDTRGSASNLLVPDFATTTQVGERQLYIVLLEGKIAGNAGLGQNWDDQSKLGYEMKTALDSILKLEPHHDVCVIGVFVREPLVEFYTMQIHAEATYIMHKFGASYISPDAMNAFPLVHLMEMLEHAKTKVEKTVEQIRRVKIKPSSTPKVPLSWLRPSFSKPKLCRVDDE